MSTEHVEGNIVHLRQITKRGEIGLQQLGFKKDYAELTSQTVRLRIQQFVAGFKEALMADLSAQEAQEQLGLKTFETVHTSEPVIVVREHENKLHFDLARVIEFSDCELGITCAYTYPIMEVDVTPDNPSQKLVLEPKRQKEEFRSDDPIVIPIGIYMY